MNSKDYKIKLVLIGDATVGKTTMRQTYMGQQFTGDYIKTIGADFATKQINYKGYNIKFQIWDLAGQYNYRSAQKSFYQGSKAAILVYDLTKRETLQNTEFWVNESIKNSQDTIQIYILVGNKNDLKREVNYEEGIDFTKKLSDKLNIKFDYLETSAKTGENINKLFESIAENFLIKEKVIEPIQPIEISSRKVFNEELFKKINELEKRVASLENEMNKFKKILIAE